MGGAVGEWDSLDKPIDHPAGTATISPLGGCQGRGPVQGLRGELTQGWGGESLDRYDNFTI